MPPPAAVYLDSFLMLNFDLEEGDYDENGGGETFRFISFCINAGGGGFVKLGLTGQLNLTEGGG